MPARRSSPARASASPRSDSSSGTSVTPRTAATACPRNVFRQHVHEAVLADREADPGRLRAAEVRDELVVPAAAEERVLRAEAGGGDLEDGAGVVVEAADEAGLDPVRDPRRVEQRAGAPRGALGRIRRRQEVDHPRQRRAASELLRAAGSFESRTRSGFSLEAPPVVRAEHSLLRRKPGAQRLDVTLASSASVPTELSDTERPAKPSRPRKSNSMTRTSASVAASAGPSTSAPICRNSR